VTGLPRSSGRGPREGGRRDPDRFTPFHRAIVQEVATTDGDGYGVTALHVTMHPARPIPGWNLGSVLLCLSWLSKRSLLEERLDGAVKRYRVTDAGRAKLAERQP
jgi:hypothetical protein